MITTWKTVRVFISSTFRDMQAERDHLVRFVFPKLRQELLQRRIHFVDVDLRWGVTSEQDALSVCREVVDECRPRLLCVLGGRYGWVPPGKTRSITADEVHYGVLDRDLKSRGFAYFYFRDPSATAAMVEVTPGEFREPAGSHGDDALAELKTAIIETGLQPFIYRAQWDDQSRRLIGLKEFGNRVYADLKQSIDQEFGPTTGEKPDEFTEENSAMEAFIEERVQRFVLGSRQTVWNELLRHTESTGGNGYLCLTGEAGSGKSALLGKFCQDYRAAHPQDLVIPHFVGTSPGSTDVWRTLRRLCHELVTGAGLTAEIPEDPEKLRVAFAEILQQASTGKRVVILVDAINQFDPTTQLAGWSWLPEELPAKTRIILSTLSGPALESLRQRRQPPRLVQLQPLDAQDREAIIRDFLHRYRKSMTNDQRAALLAKADAGTPLYLLVALEELRTLGTYEEITDRIAQLPPDTRALFIWILKRLEDDDGFRDASGREIGRELVTRFVSLMGASRHGLSQQELVELLSPGDPQGNVAALAQLLRPYLMQRGELLDFYHGQFREAVATSCLPSEPKRLAAHNQLATYFRDKADPERNQHWKGSNPRPFSELPFHLVHAQMWPELVATLEDIFFLEAKIAYGLAFELVRDCAEAVQHLPDAHPQRNILRLLEEAIRRDIQFIAQHTKDFPQGLFQCLWNSCWWYDCPEAKRHYESPDGPWNKPGEKLCELVQSWRNQKEKNCPGFIWLRTLRPLPLPLGTGQLAILSGHDYEAFSVGYSLDGRRIVSGSLDKTVRVWDVASGAQLVVFNGDEYLVRSVSFSPDGRRIVSGGGEFEGTVRIWNADNGQQLLDFRGHEKGVTGVCWSPNGRCVVSGSLDKTVRVWNAISGDELAVIRHNAEVSSVTFSSDGKRVAVGLMDATVRILDAGNWTELTVLCGHEKGVTSVSYSPDCQRIASGSFDRTVRVWDAISGTLLVVLDGYQREVLCVRYSPDGRSIISGTKGRRVVRKCNGGGSLEPTVFFGDDGWVRSVDWSPDSGYFVSGAEDGTVRVWAATTNSDLSFPSRGFGDHGLDVVCFSPDGGRIVSRVSDQLQLWDTLSGIKLTELYVGYTRKCKSILFSPDGGEIVCLSGRPGSGKGKELIIFNTLTGADLVILRGHELEISSVSWSPDGRYLASGSEDKSVRIWDAISGSQLAVLLGHEDAVTSVEWSSDGGRVVSRTDGAVMRIWDIATGECVRKQSREEDIHANLSVPASISIRAFVRGSETIIEDTVTRSPIAFYPVPIGSICTHPTGRILAGSIAFSTVFCLITIEGGILPLVSMNQTSAGT